MDTERLISTLAADGAETAMPMRRAWIVAIAVSAIIAAMVFSMSIGPRADIAEAAGTMRFLFKFVVTLSLFGTALATLAALARPGATVRSVLPMLVLAPGLLLVSVGIEMMVIPADQVASRWIGTNALTCLVSIPLIGIGPLAAFLFTLRHGASTRPSLGGAVAGLVAGGLAATFYAAHCLDDSPLFVATWYPLAIAFLTIAGAIAGRFVARW